MLSANEIRTLIFDLSEVLIAGFVGIDQAIADHVGASPDQIMPMLDLELLFPLFRGHVTEEMFIERMTRRLNHGVTKTEIKQLIRQNFHQRVPGMESLLNRLSGYELVLLSDHAREWVAYIHDVHPFLKRFNRQFFSFELGSMKSEAETFVRVLTALKRQPSECLFIDDNPNNVAVARSVGLDAVQFQGAEELRNELERRNVLH